MNSIAALIRYRDEVLKNASARKPPRIARRKAVPMKLVTMLEELDGEKCMNVDMYKTRLLALAIYARFSNTSTATVYNTKIRMYCFCK